jgi:hypothetical protein
MAHLAGHQLVEEFEAGIGFIEKRSRVQCHGSATFFAAAWAAGWFPSPVPVRQQRTIESEGALGCRMFYNAHIIPEIKAKRNRREGLRIIIAVVSAGIVW